MFKKTLLLIALLLIIFRCNKEELGVIKINNSNSAHVEKNVDLSFER